MDIVPLEEVDIVHIMIDVPWLFNESEIDELVFDDVLEQSNKFWG